MFGLTGWAHYVSDYEELQGRAEERDKLVKNLEAVETESIKMARKNQMGELSENDSSSAEKAQITDAAVAEEQLPADLAYLLGIPTRSPKIFMITRVTRDPIKSVRGLLRLGHGVIGGLSAITRGVRRLSGQVEDHIPSAAYGYQAGGDDSSTNLLLLENKLPSNFGKLVKHGNPKLARMKHRERGDQNLLAMKLCLGRMATAVLN
ncbi:unnamed protein product [Tuber aestivum]|uniref:Uncharacterized protein n=1 Tax=Tuber aestivum TaxID=59557 RepID=A0A292PHV4_9PEZI|nr:unnamed protein product [Tuber aestivum]